MADVYDFKTGRLCKRCDVCRFWKDLEDFDPNPHGKYDRSDMCVACKDKANKTQRASEIAKIDQYCQNWMDRYDAVTDDTEPEDIIA